METSFQRLRRKARRPDETPVTLEDRRACYLDGMSPAEIDRAIWQARSEYLTRQTESLIKWLEQIEISG